MPLWLLIILPSLKFYVKDRTATGTIYKAIDYDIYGCKESDVVVQPKPFGLVIRLDF